MDHFKAELKKIGVNPYVLVPEDLLASIFVQADKNKGFIPICGTINLKPYKQTLVKFKGVWRLYVNMQMLKNSPERIGGIFDITIKFDPTDRSIKPHPKFEKALMENERAKNVFNSLRPSRQKEIIRYISFLKTEESIDRNIAKAIAFLSGTGTFVGRDKPYSS